MSGALAGKVIAVTGAGRGIGRDIALLAAREGAKVVVNDIGASLSGEGGEAGPAEAVVVEIEQTGGEALAHTRSIAEPEGALSLIEETIGRFGRIDGVVNNAGILRDKIFHRMQPEDWEAVIRVHLMGSFYVSRAAAPYFREQGSGAFVHFTSTSGLIGNLGQANYAAAKLGIAGLSRSIALDMQRFGVRSNCVAPFAWSRMIGSIPTDTPEQEARVAKLQQMTPAKIAPLVAHLLSDAADDVSGQIFGVRNNEIFVFTQPRPARSVHRGEGWSAQSIAEHAMPALKAGFTPLEVSADVFSWDPV
ncbi:SDR family NAD(P)-dependent oxidoreductase [Saliniramus fredricksonii]|uniref:NAD(P)-dependent dehydrogenase, short-chain alcohol dehydrogenase family n=1 Tax=Saliniramus fredricksonii TaxID=1653334 RepID=A0ABY0K9J6_9HYPH|nr:SDR family NAD(P)-dependent oxidoreductase [Saliniramus fredricksonii]SCC81166.1 NAD(P)-dependent dehydrogenase, short-chain alcohol dehydrogenase family [Saliniramus fredricksonii]